MKPRFPVIRLSPERVEGGVAILLGLILFPLLGRLERLLGAGELGAALVEEAAKAGLALVAVALPLIMRRLAVSRTAFSDSVRNLSFFILSVAVFASVENLAYFLASGTDDSFLRLVWSEPVHLVAALASALGAAALAGLDSGLGPGGSPNPPRPGTRPGTRTGNPPGARLRARLKSALAWFGLAFAWHLGANALAAGRLGRLELSGATLLVSALVDFAALALLARRFRAIVVIGGFLYGSRRQRP